MAERLYGGLQIKEDLERQVRAWKWERVGWAAIAAFVAAALAGLIGPGPLSSTVAPGGSAPLEGRMQRSRVDESDVLERMDRIKYAVLQRHGGITVVPRRA